MTGGRARTGHGGTGTRTALRPLLLPERRTLVDLGLLVALAAAALLGLATTYTGLGFFVVGMVGVLLGVVLAQVSVRLGWPAIAPVVLGLAAYFLLGAPLCLRSEGLAVPGPDALDQLADQLVFGWKDLLTTLPPVDGDGPLLALPWAMGLATGLLGALLVGLRSGPVWLRVALPLLAPGLLLVGVILLGVRHPQSLLIQGACFAVLAIGWLALRAQRETAPVRGGVGARTRLAMGAVLVGVAGTLALPVAGWATGSDTGRVVLRTYVEPPFDVGQYPSPLASFRRYVKMPKPDAVNLYDKTLLTVDGAPSGSRLRIATLDKYDGVVWGAANDTVPGSTVDTFQRVSSTIDNPVAGDRIEVEVTVGEGYSGVWLPTMGALQSMEFGDGDPEAKEESFRYNLATSTAVVPSGLRAGDSYTFTAVRPESGVDADASPSGLVTDAAFAAAFLDTQAVQWSAGESEPMRRVFAAAEHLKQEGKYSDGVIESEKIYHPGHHVKRLSDEFVNAPIMVGNDEQYAATMALVANKIGVPARVVMGAVVPEDGVVRGRDVQAWVELQVADGSWRTLPTETFMDTDRPAEQPPINEQEMSGTQVPPPAPIPPPSTAGEQTDAELNARKGDREVDDGWAFPAWLRALLLYLGLPILVVLLLMGGVVLAKHLRRRRRRAAARVSSRFVGGWRELVDHARDLGQAVPRGSGVTRREQSLVVASAGASGLARRADGHVFGPMPPQEAEAASYWSSIDAERQSMSRAVSRRRRLLAAVNLATFRR